MTRYLSLAEYVWLAEYVTGVDAAVLAKASRLDLADSALHAPGAGFGDDDLYPDLFDKAAMLAVAAGKVDEAWFAGWLRTRVRCEAME